MLMRDNQTEVTAAAYSTNFNINNILRSAGAQREILLLEEIFS